MKFLHYFKVKLRIYIIYNYVSVYDENKQQIVYNLPKNELSSALPISCNLNKYPSTCSFSILINSSTVGFLRK